MANHKSALKKIRQDEKRKQRNKAVRTRYRNLIKSVREAVETGEADKAKEALAATVPYLQSAVTKGVIHKNKAARHVSRLTKQVNGL